MYVLNYTGKYNVLNASNVKWCQPIHTRLSAITVDKHKRAHPSMGFSYVAIAKVKFGTSTA